MNPKVSAEYAFRLTAQIHQTSTCQQKPGPEVSSDDDREGCVLDDGCRADGALFQLLILTCLLLTKQLILRENNQLSQSVIYKLKKGNSIPGVTMTWLFESLIFLTP